jgi:hypothetical protein
MEVCKLLHVVIHVLEAPTNTAAEQVGLDGAKHELVDRARVHIQR